MTAKITRRKLAAALAAPALAMAQPQQAPPAAPGDEMEAARLRLGTATEALAREEVAAAVEPAFQFKA